MEELTSTSDESTRSTTLTRSIITVKERVKLCLMPTYRPRMVRNKGAILVLALNLFVMSTPSLVWVYWPDNYGFAAGLVGVSLIVPFAGWLADTRIGRFKVIRGSVWIMWTTIMLMTLSVVLAKLIDGYDKANENVLTVLFVVMAIGLGAYLTSIVQFGLDQLTDASTIEIKSFIIWFICTFTSGGNIVSFFSLCVSERYRIFLFLSVCLCLTLALALLLLCHQKLIKEPVKQNPLKLVYKVIKYAIKTKSPQRRSAFTYCEDYLPSRMDFGKMKYGGPFTTEQVEDVKTMLRIIPLLIIAGAFSGGMIVASNYRDKFVDLVSNKILLSNKITLQSRDESRYSKRTLSECYTEASYTNIYVYNPLVFVFLYEALIYPLFYRCMTKIESLHKVLTAMLLELIRIAVLMVYNVISRQTFIGENNMNETVGCLFQASHGILHNSFSSQLIVLPDFISSVSLLMIYSGAVEFLSAQVPYSMKGLMIGLCYYFIFLSIGAWIVIIIPFRQYSSLWGTGIISCGFWLLLLAGAIQTMVFLTLLMFKVRYKKRKREDLLRNEQAYAEDYYSKDETRNAVQ